MFGFTKKIGMTRLYLDGRYMPVTVLLYPDQYVVQTKTKEKEGYQSVQIGAFTKTKATRSKKGHIQKHSKADVKGDFGILGEFWAEDFVTPEDKILKIDNFIVGDLLKVTGTVKGRGFAGAVKRHGFGGQPASHGHDHERAVGSIGAGWPQRVLPGTKMAGRMGGKKNTIANLKIVAIDPENSLLFVKGSVTGSKSSYLKVKKITN